MYGCLRSTELSPNTRKKSRHTWRRRKETLGVFGEYTKRHKSVYISVNNHTNFYFLKILFINTVWNGLSQKNIPRYCPFKGPRSFTFFFLIGGNVEYFKTCRLIPLTPPSLVILQYL